MKIKTVESVAVLPSTNDYIRQNLATFKSGVCLRALEQTHGRGRRGNKWISGGKLNLTFSFLITADTHLSHEIFMATALALKAVLRNNYIDANIKLPNDIYVGDKKIAGMLIETLKIANKVNHICGIGLNVNESTPMLYAPFATSMLKEQTQMYEIDKILTSFIELYNHYIVLDDTFSVFKSALFEREHMTTYQGHKYLLEDIKKTFMCTISNDTDIQTISCDKLTFSLK